MPSEALIYLQFQNKSILSFTNCDNLLYSTKKLPNFALSNYTLAINKTNFSKPFNRRTTPITKRLKSIIGRDFKKVKSKAIYKGNGVFSDNHLQVIHPTSPHEKEWVVTAGNETAVDNVLAIR